MASNVLALDRQRGKVAREALLGRVIWYFIPENDALLDYKHVVGALHSAGFTRKAPTEPNDRNVFLRVTKSVERTLQHDLDPDKRERWMVRDVSMSDESTVTRRLVMELCDPALKVLDWYEIVDFVYDRTTKKITFQWIGLHDAQSDPTAQQIIGEVQTEYAKWRGKLNAYSIREWLRKTLLDMKAVPAKASGGIYFLEEENADQIEALETFVATMIPNGGQCHSLEVPDNDKQREMVRKAIENETVGAIEAKMVEIDKIRQAGKLTPDKYMELMADVEAIKSKMKAYEKLLESNMDDITSRLDLLNMQASMLSPMQQKITRTKKAKADA